MNKICLIDNYDSFTYNIVHLLQKVGAEVIVLRNNCSIKDILDCSPDKIILSPGPGSPKESGICFDVIDFFKEKKDILGICLGHQIIAEYFGCTVGNAKNVMHGKKAIIRHDQKGIFNSVKNPLEVARYHSLSIKKMSKELDITSVDVQDEEIMSIKHKSLCITGVQFHPESFLTNSGELIMKNFIYNIKSA